jgi:hypothetical protein
MIFKNKNCKRAAAKAKKVLLALDALRIGQKELILCQKCCCQDQNSIFEARHAADKAKRI